MGRIALPRRFYQQPQGAVEIDPEWGLAGVATPQGYSELSGQVSIKVDRLGNLAWEDTGAVNKKVVVYDLPLYNGDPEATFIGYYATKVLDGTPLVFGETGPVTGAWELAGSECQYRYVGAIATLPITLAVNKYALVVLTLGADGGKAYVDGVLQSTDPNPPQVSTNTTPGGKILGNNTQGTRGQGSVLYGAWARRVMSPIEIARLAENPWQIFRPQKRVLYFDAGGGAAVLAIPGDTHGHAADALVLSANLALAVGGDAHGHSADAPALSAELALSIAASAHAHMADGPVLSSAQVLAVADALHAHAAAALALTSDSALAVGGDAHAHTADGMTLSATGADDLIIAGDMHGHAADAVALTSASMLAVAGALHAHSSDTAELGAALALSITGGLHAHNAASLTLTDVPTLGAADALHAHGAASLALSTDVLLAIADAVHAHLADDVDMTYAATLAILESMHAHAADSIALTSGGGSALGLPDEIRVAIRERFILAVAAERRILRS